MPLLSPTDPPPSAIRVLNTELLPDELFCVVYFPDPPLPTRILNVPAKIFAFSINAILPAPPPPLLFPPPPPPITIASDIVLA